MFSLFRKKPAPVAEDWRASGNAALAEGKLQEAARWYERGTQLEPTVTSAWVNLGFAQLHLQQLPQARASLERAAGVAGAGEPLVPDIHYMLGQVHQQQGDAQAALACYRQAIAARPAFVEALVDAARILYRLGEHAQALQSLDAALACDATQVEALEGRGNVLVDLDRSQEALADFERVLALRGPHPDTLSNASGALWMLGRFEESLARACQALELEPTHRNALFNKVQVLLDLRRPEEALAASEQAAQHHPGDADLLWNQAVARLVLGDLERGWPAYEARWRAPMLGHRDPPPGRGRPWDGQADLSGRSILLFAEQGLGDTIQFVRFVPEVARQAARVLLRVQAPLAPLLRDLPPNCELLPPAAVPDVDYECSLMSLPWALRTDWDSLPRQVPYLRADGSLAAAWHERLAAAGPQALNVGITWSGNPGHRNDRNRSMRLEVMRHLSAAGCRFVSLQPEVRPEDRPALQAWPELLRWGEELRDFGDTAALMQALDLVVAVDTSVVHLAGALGRPVWVLLPHAPEWRWLLEREDSPWYPTAKLYRQAARQDWTPVLARVRADLQQLADRRAGTAE